jgi:putative flippase GtrA
MGFLTAGGSAALLQWSSRLLLSLWLEFSAAILAAYAISMPFAFCSNSLFVFRHAARPRQKQARDFMMINIAFFPLVCGASIGLDHALRNIGMRHATEAVAHASAIGLPMMVTFLLYKFFVFKEGVYGRS